MFKEEILLKAGQFLNVLRDDSFRAIESKENQKARDSILQALDYCEFLIRGYNYINQSDIANRFVNEREMFAKDLEDIK